MGHFGISEMVSDLWEYERMHPEGLNPPRGESPPPLRVVPTFGLPHVFGWSRPSVSHLGGYPLILK